MDRRTRVSAKDPLVPREKKMNIKKFMTFVFLLPACRLLINMQSGSGGEKQGAVVAPGKAAGLDKEAVMAKSASLAVPFVRNAGRFNKEFGIRPTFLPAGSFSPKKSLFIRCVKDRGKRIRRPAASWPSRNFSSMIKGV